MLREEQPEQPLIAIRTWPVRLERPPQAYPLAFSSILTTGTGRVTFRFGGSAHGFTAFLDDVSLTPPRGA